jgi:uncharacterized hydrophobic protein (TIGR00271 family)
VFHLRLYGPSNTVGDVGDELERNGIARHLTLARALRPGHSLLTAEVRPESADAVVDLLQTRGVAADDVVLTRRDEIWPAPDRRATTSLIWADVLATARQNARSVARYLIFMMAAGVIAGFGVLYDNTTLIVGAMAVSPDTLPLTAACVALVTGRGKLAQRGLLTLALGLTVTCMTALVLAALLDLLNGIPSDFDVGESSLSDLTTVNSAIVGVALAAGVAGMLAVETRASAAVGVAISVTTIPAAAYLGVAAGVGEPGKVPGTLAVLGVNVSLLLLSGVATLLVQRRFAAPTPGGRAAPRGRRRRRGFPQL